MNSIVGKFSQRTTYPGTKFASSTADIEGILNSGNIIQDFTVLGENICELQVEPTTPTMTEPTNRKNNPVIAAFVTALSRIDMHTYITLLNNHEFVPMYTDTDSIIFYGPQGKIPPLPISSNLGDFRQEYKNAEGFCCIGKKNYAVSVSGCDEKPILKVRGISFKPQKSREVISFKTFENFLKGKEKAPTIQQSHIFKGKNPCEVSHKLVGVNLATKLNFNRILRKTSHYSTFPYGYLNK